MGRHLAIGIYVVALGATVVGVGILIFRHNVWARLLANVGIVLVLHPSTCDSTLHFGVRPGQRVAPSSLPGWRHASL